MRLTSLSLSNALGMDGPLANQWYTALMDVFAEQRITSDKEILYLIAQMAYESQSFKRLRENMSYITPERIVKVFPKDVQPNEAAGFVRQPIRLANRVYAFQNGNGSEASGDGWKYRGGGCIMLTGKGNYKRYSGFCGQDLVKEPGMITSPQHAVRSAVWFWITNNLKRYAEADDITGMTRIIVGSGGSAFKRDALYQKLKAFSQ